MHLVGAEFRLRETQSRDFGDDESVAFGLVVLARWLLHLGQGRVIGVVDPCIACARENTPQRRRFADAAQCLFDGATDVDAEFVEQAPEGTPASLSTAAATATLARSRWSVGFVLRPAFGLIERIDHGACLVAVEFALLHQSQDAVDLFAHGWLRCCNVWILVPIIQ